MAAESTHPGQGTTDRRNSPIDSGHLSRETAPSDAEVRLLEDRLDEDNAQHTGVDDGQWVALFLRDEHGTMQAGLTGWAWCGSCSIQTVWVHQDLRGQGIGTHLLQAAEQEARARGCRQIVLGSYSFQAPGFYQKWGFEVFAVLEEHPRGHRQYYLRKRLT